MKKEAPFVWDERCQQGFDVLKLCIMSAPVLTLPNDEQPFRVKADTSDFATGGVLQQLLKVDDKWHPVTFILKSLSPVERNYEVHDKELLAIVRCLEQWRHFLEGAKHPVEVWTDHRNLQYFKDAQNLNRRQARWSLFLNRFDYHLHHRPGVSMGEPDGLFVMPRSQRRVRGQQGSGVVGPRRLQHPRASRYIGSQTAGGHPRGYKAESGAARNNGGASGSCGEAVERREAERTDLQD